MCEDISSEHKIADIDGNIYDSVVIGSQIWMTENLRVTKYNNGDPIPGYEIKSCLDIKTGEFFNFQKGDYCFYDNDEEFINQNGCLYNWYAVNDDRQIAPFGWHVPSLEDWEVLFNFLGGELIVGDKLKMTGLNSWGSRKTNSDNSSGFSAVPSGFRSIDGLYKGLNYYCYWWTSTKFDELRSWFCYLKYGVKYATFKNDLNLYGFSIRLIRDNYDLSRNHD